MSEVEKELQDKRRLLSLLKQKRQLMEENGVYFYTPHPKQDLFHRSGERTMRYLRMGNRGGKSTCGSAEDIAWCLGERVWYPKGDPGRTKGIPRRPVKILLICQDWDKSREIFTNIDPGAAKGKLFMLMPKDKFVQSFRNHSGAIDRIVVKGKYGMSSIFIDTVKSYTQNPMGMESSDWDAIHVDEPCPEGMYKASARGLIDRAGKSWFLCTPITEPWINDLFVPGFMSLSEQKKKAVLTYKDRIMITGSMDDNPWLSKKAKDDFISLLTPEEIEARVKGVPSAYAGRIYTEFDERHIIRGIPYGWEDVNKPPANWTIRYAIDPHPQLPTAVLFAATSPKGQTVFYAELFVKDLICNIAEMILDVLNQGGSLFGGILDPYAYTMDPRDGTNMACDFLNAGLFLAKASKDLSRGIQLTKQALKQRKKIYFHESLVRTLWEIDRYTWNPKKPGTPIDRDDHMMENLYRLVIFGLDWDDPMRSNVEKHYEYDPLDTLPDEF